MAASRVAGRQWLSRISYVDVYRLLVMDECVQKPLWLCAAGSRHAKTHGEKKRRMVREGRRRTRLRLTDNAVKQGTTWQTLTTFRGWLTCRKRRFPVS